MAGNAVEPTSFVSGALTWPVNGTNQDIFEMPGGVGAGGFSAQRAYRQRNNRAPIRDQITVQPRRWQCAFLANTPGVSDEQFEVNAGLLFDTNPRTQPKTIIGLHPLHGNTISLDVDVLSAVPNSETPWERWDVDLEAADFHWLAANTTIGSTYSAPTTTATPNNIGDAPTFAQIAMTPNSGGVNYRQITVTDGTGRGLSNHWVRVEFPSTLAAPTNYYVFHGGKSVPFWMQLRGGTTAVIDVRMLIPAGGPAVLDIFYDANLINPTTANRLNEAQLGSDIATYALTNDLLIWDNYTLSSAPEADFSLLPKIVGKVQSNVSFGLALEGNSGCTFRLSTAGEMQNDANGFTIVLGREANAGPNNLVNLRRVLTINKGGVGTSRVDQLGMSGVTAGQYAIQMRDAQFNVLAQSVTLNYNADATALQNAFTSLYGAGNVTVTGTYGTLFVITFTGTLALKEIENPWILVQPDPVGFPFVGVQSGPFTVVAGSPASAQAFIRYRVAGQMNWTDAWSTTAPGTYDTPVSIPGAVQIAVGIEPFAGYTGDLDATLHLENISGRMSIGMNTSLHPIIAGNTGSPGTAYELNGTLVNSTTGQTITFDHVFMLNDTLNIDTDTGKVSTTVGSLVYGRITFNDTDLWLTLNPGSNTIAATMHKDDGTVVGTPLSVTWRPRYAVV